MNNQPISNQLCANCQNEVPAGNKFCSNCGRAQNYDDYVVQTRKWPNIKQVGLFFIIEILCCAASLIIKERSLTTLYCLEVLMAINALLFFGNSWAENKTILKWPGFSGWKLAVLIAVTILASMLVTFSVGHLNEFVFKTDHQYYSLFAFHKYGTYIMFAAIALYPAIFEELAYRGYLMQKLLSIVDEKEAIYISAILFFIIHFSLISIFWLLPFALFLGWLRIKTKTLWYGVVVHFFFNLTACFLELYPLEDLFKMIF